jgi:hypothetical protein
MQLLVLVRFKVLRAMVLKTQVSWNVSWSLGKKFLTFWRIVVPSTSVSRRPIRMAAWDKHCVNGHYGPLHFRHLLSLQVPTIIPFQSQTPIFNNLFLTFTHLVSLLMHYVPLVIPDAPVNTARWQKCQGKHCLASDLCCASIQCPSNSPHISSFTLFYQCPCQ